MITDILFDFFGTLVQYIAGPFHSSPYQRSYSYLLQQGIKIAYEDFVAGFTDVSEKLELQARATYDEYHMDQVGRAFFRQVAGVEVPNIILKTFIAHFIDEWSRGIVYFDSIEQFLSQLRRSYRLSIVSNTHYPALIDQHLAAMGVAGYFTHIVTSVEFGKRKPHPSIFQYALGLCGIEPASAFYIGDTYIDDYQGARAANLRCVLLDPKNRYPDVPDRVATLFDVEPYLKRFAGRIA